MTGRQLYRDPVNGKITGVCAGLADYFGLEIWLVRILVVTAALLGGSFLVIVAYVAFTLMLEKQPHDYQQSVKTSQEHKIKSKAWQAGQTPDRFLAKIDEELDGVDKRVRAMEAYVTSETFKVNRAFNKL